MFLKLTVDNGESPFFINMDHIIALKPDLSGPGTVFCPLNIDEPSFRVRESCQEIMDMMSPAQAKKDE
jgi:hypothetical protein